MELSVQCHLRKLLYEKGMEQKTLHQITGIREMTISEMCRNINQNFSRVQIVEIMKALELTDINQLITVEVIKKDDPQ
ncbi:helix-turn-helix domain-containing protein [Paenibacillus oleatilyticus]|uniref:helix-turn-helix domain-containing protein n=1 Tax=Paenibacillus oleatilyticus TaxID=2594886 RepID=UPI001C1F9DB0|nr:helix-turn-helix domain-containing protein [Paenibacillus oleatilyticus]MBU7316120.1 helix-turn-helix transcriptional regulator [Paenibacillus oleatilyticus]